MSFSSLIPLLIILLSLFSHTSHSLKCTSQTFKDSNKLYKNCTDLPTLNSYLHYTYDAGKSSLSVAFIAPPAKSDGWIAWGINPNGTGMVGTQALIAYKKSNGKMTVKTFNLVSYRSIVPSDLSFDVSDKSAEYSDGLMTIFAKLELPKNMTTVNQVWQVGASVHDDFPAKHAFDPANLSAKAELKLVEVQKNGTAVSSGNSTSPSGDGDSKKNSSFRISENKFGFYLLILLFVFGILA